MFNESAALRTAVFAILENRRWRVLSNPQSGRGLKFHHIHSPCLGVMPLKMRPTLQILTILFNISRVNFFPDIRYMNDHVGDYVVTTYLWQLVDNSFLGEIASASGMTMPCFHHKES